MSKKSSVLMRSPLKCRSLQFSPCNRKFAQIVTKRCKSVWIPHFKLCTRHRSVQGPVIHQSTAGLSSDTRKPHIITAEYESYGATVGLRGRQGITSWRSMYMYIAKKKSHLWGLYLRGIRVRYTCFDHGVFASAVSRLADVAVLWSSLHLALRSNNSARS